MGQVKSHIAGYFTEKKDENVTNENENSDWKSTSNSSYVRKKIKFSNDRVFIDNSNVDSSPLQVDSIVTPRQPLKRTRQFSPHESTSLPQSILDIFSPPKKIKTEDEFLNFSFLQDAETVNYYRKSKILIILRGLPGSGKSTIANHIKRKYIASQICSADNFFMKDGEYIYDGSRIREAHTQCQESAIQAVQDQLSPVIIDNTNLKRWEMTFYLNLAQEFNYIPIIVEPQTPWKTDFPTLASKTLHDVGEEIIKLKAQDFERLEPVYYGWFLNERDSVDLLQTSYEWWKHAYSCPEFKKDASKFSKTFTFQDFFGHYAKPSKGFLLHCTANYIGKDMSAENEEYIDGEEVGKALGKACDIAVVGFVITPRTIGARIKLSAEQMRLWGMDDGEEVPESFYDVILEEEDSEQEEVVENGNSEKHSEEGRENELLNSSQGNGLSEKSLPLNEEVISGEESPPENGLEKHNHSNGLSEESVNGGKNANEPEGPVNSHDEGEMVNSSSDKVPSTKMTSLNTVTDGESIKSFEKHNGSSESRKNGITENDTSSSTIIDVSLTSSVEAETNICEADTSLDELQGRKKNSSGGTEQSPIKKFAKKKRGVSIPQNELQIEDSVTRSTWSAVDEGMEIPPTRGKGSRAHITLGCAPTYKAVTTGLDLIMAVRKEAELLREGKEGRDQAPVFTASLEGGEIYNYGHGVWVIYLEETLMAKAIFAVTL